MLLKTWNQLNFGSTWQPPLFIAGLNLPLTSENRIISEPVYNENPVEHQLIRTSERVICEGINPYSSRDPCRHRGRCMQCSLCSHKQLCSICIVCVHRDPCPQCDRCNHTKVCHKCDPCPHRIQCYGCDLKNTKRNRGKKKNKRKMKKKYAISSHETRSYVTLGLEKLLEDLKKIYQIIHISGVNLSFDQILYNLTRDQLHLFDGKIDTAKIKINIVWMARAFGSEIDIQKKKWTCGCIKKTTYIFPIVECMFCGSKVKFHGDLFWS